MSPPTPGRFILRNNAVVNLYVSFYGMALQGLLASSGEHIDVEMTADLADQLAIASIERFDSHVATEEEIRQAQEGEANEQIIYPNGPRVKQ